MPGNEEAAFYKKNIARYCSFVNTNIGIYFIKRKQEGVLFFDDKTMDFLQKKITHTSGCCQ